MGRAAKRNRITSGGKNVSAKDFAKKKTKLGRRARADNATDVTVRTRQIHLPKHKLSEQEPETTSNAPTSSITPVVVDQHVSRATHHNSGARTAAFNALRNLAKSPSVHAKAAVNVRLPVLIATSGGGLADATRAVRRAAGDLLCALISPNDSTSNSSRHLHDRANTMLTSISPHILAALSDVRHDVCVDAARLLTALINPPCYINAVKLFPTGQDASRNPFPGLTLILTNSRDPSHRTAVLDAITAVLSSTRPAAQDSNATWRHSETPSRFYYHARNQKTLSYIRKVPSVMSGLKTNEVVNLTRRIAHVVSESLPSATGEDGNPAVLNSAALALAAVARELCSIEVTTDCSGSNVIRTVLQDCSSVSSLIAEGFGRLRGKESDTVAIALANAALSIGANSFGVDMLRKVLALGADRRGREYMTVGLMNAVQRAVTSSEKALIPALSSDSDMDEDSDDDVDPNEDCNIQHLNELRALITDTSRMLVYYANFRDRQVTSRILPLAPTLITACQTLPRLEKTRTKLLAGLPRAVKLCVRPRGVAKDKGDEDEQMEGKGEAQQKVFESDRDDHGEVGCCAGEKALLVGIEAFEIARLHTPPTPISVHVKPEHLGRAMTINEITWMYAKSLMGVCIAEDVIRLLSTKSMTVLAGMIARIGPSILLSSPVVRMVARGLRCRSVTGPATQRDEKEDGKRLLASRVFLDAMESIARHNSLPQWWTRRLQAASTVLGNVVERVIKSLGNGDNGSREHQDLCLGLEEVRLQLQRMSDLVLQEDLYD